MFATNMRLALCVEMLRIDYASVYIFLDLAEPKVVEPDDAEYFIYFFPFGFLFSSVKKIS